MSVSVGDVARREAELRERAILAGALRACAAGDGAAPDGGGGTLVTSLMQADQSCASLSEAGSDVGGGSGSVSGSVPGTWRHACATCGRHFLDNYHLKRHVKAIHEGPRPYACDHPVVVAPEGELNRAVVEDGEDPTRTQKDGGDDGGQGEEGIRQRQDGNEKKKGKPAEEGGGTAAEAKATRAGSGVCGAAFAKKWQLREHLQAAHGQTK